MSSFSARYTLRVPLGESALGSVWTALDRETQQQVAVLRLEEEAATETARARFRDHAERLLAIDHPNVVKALDHGDDDDGIPYLAVELLEGESLAARWASAPIRIDRFVELAVGVAEGLGALHAAGFAHGDVEPGNVFLVGAKGMETPKLIGIALNRVYARVGDDGEGRTSVATLHQLYAYAAPEQVKGEVVDSPVADLYSLAAVVYAGLAGSPPHVAPTVMALLESVTRKKAPTLAQVKRELSAFSATLDRALSAEPGRRFPDATSFARALKTCLVMARSLAGQDIPVGSRSPIGQPIVIAGSSAGSTTAPKPLGRSMPKPGALAVGSRNTAATPSGPKAESAVAQDEPTTREADAKGGAATGVATGGSPETSPRIAMPAARPFPRPAAKKTIQGLPLASRPLTAAATATPTATSEPAATDEAEGRTTEELEIPIGSEVPPPPPPPRPPTPAAALEERPSLEFEDYASSEIPLPPSASPPPPPPARAVRADAAPKSALEDEAIAPATEAEAETTRAGADIEAPDTHAGDAEAEAAAKPAANQPAADLPPANQPAETRAAGTKADTKPVDAEAEPTAAQADAKPPAPRATESLARPKPAAPADPIASEPVLAPLDGDDAITPSRPAWIMPVAVAAVALLVVIGGVVAFGGGGGPTADEAEPPIVGASGPSATDPEPAAATAETGTAGAEAPEGETAAGEIAEAEVAAAEVAAAEVAAAEVAAAEEPEVAEADPTEPGAATLDTAADDTAADDTAVAADTAAAPTADARAAEAAPEPAARRRTVRRTAATRTARTDARATSRPRTTRPAATRGGTRGRPTVVADPGF